MKAGKLLACLALVIFGTTVLALRLSLADVTTVPNAPSNLEFQPAANASTIFLQWNDNSSDETSFNVDRKFVSDANYAGMLHWAQLPANTTTFADTNVSPGQHYDYRVTACNTVGCSESINRSDVVTSSASSYCTALSLTVNKSSYVKGEDVNYTYTCSAPSTTTTIQSATVQVVKPDGVATTYNTGSGLSTSSLGFSTSNLDAGAYTLRVCLDSACTTAGMATFGFAVTAPTTTSTNANWVNHTWTFNDGTSTSYILVRTDAEYTTYITSVDTQCRQISKTKLSWKSGAGDDAAANWRNFGIPDCSGTATTTTTPTPTPSPTTAGSCQVDSKCAAGSWCQGGGMQCYYPDSSLTCVAMPTFTGATSTPMYATCPAGTSSCKSTDASCLTNGQTVPYSSSKWCTQSMTYYSTDGKNMTCSQSDQAPAGYTACRPGDTSCRQKGDSWTDSNSSNYCMGGQKCSLAAGGGMCVGWNESCPSGTKYCSGSDTNCVEPENYKTLSTTTSGNSSYWCGGGGMGFYSGTQIYCPAKKSSQAAMMWTADDVKAILAKLGSGWGMCRPGESNCIEPGKTGSSNGWCAWYPPNSSMMSMPANGTGPRTCPSLDGTITPPPTPVCAVTNAPKCSVNETATQDQNGCYTGLCTVTKKPICPAITAVQCPAGQVQKSTVNGDGCAVTSCVATAEIKECSLNETPSPTNMCMMPMYHWNIAAKTYEKCDAAAKNAPYLTIKDNLNAKYTNCEPMNFELEKEWKTKRNLVHPPEKFGDYYWPPWDAAAKQLQYKADTDQFGECDARTFGTAVSGIMPTYAYMAPCTPVPDEDKEWLLSKFRAEYKMYQLYQKQNPVTPIKPGLPVPPIHEPIPLPLVPVIQIAQCKPYLTNIRQSLNSDKMFWKDVKRNLDAVPEYSEADTVIQDLDQAKILILDIEKLMKAGKCNSDTLNKLQTAQNTLHADLFSELSSHLPALQDAAQGSQCRARLTAKQKQLENLDKASTQHLLDEFNAKFKEFDTQSSDFTYDIVYECQQFLDEMESQTNDLLRVNDKELNRIIDDVVSKQLESVIVDLTKQIEERGKKLDDLLVRIAELHQTLDAVSKSATDISQKVAVSYAGLSRIDEKFSEQKTEIQASKDQLIPSVSEAMRLMKETACVQGSDRDTLVRKVGEIATINWVDTKADDVSRRLNLFVASCRAKDLAKGDTEAFVKTIDDLAAQNAQASYKDGLTFDPTVPTHEWFYGAFQNAYKSGYVTQARPGENVLAQDALIMILKATGDTSSSGSCALQAGTVREVSPYAICAVNRAIEKGIILPSNMTIPVTRARIAEWITHLSPLPKHGSDADLRMYNDLGSTSATERSAIADVVLNHIMVGSSTDGTTFSFKPQTTLTRASLVVIIEQMSMLDSISSR